MTLRADIKRGWCAGRTAGRVYGQEIRRDAAGRREERCPYSEVAACTPQIFTTSARTRDRIRRPLTDWQRRRPLSVVPADELGLSVQHVIRFAVGQHVFAGLVRVLRVGHVTVRRVSWPGASDRYNNIIHRSHLGPDNRTRPGGGAEGRAGLRELGAR